MGPSADTRGLSPGPAGCTVHFLVGLGRRAGGAQRRHSGSITRAGHCSLLGGFRSESWWGPAQTLGVYHQGRPAVLCRGPYVLLNQFRRDTDDVLSLPVLHHVERLQGADDVCVCDTRQLTANTTTVHHC